MGAALIKQGSPQSRANVRYGTITDISAYPNDVRFTPKSGHRNLTA